MADPQPTARWKPWRRRSKRKAVLVLPNGEEIRVETRAHPDSTGLGVRDVPWALGVAAVAGLGLAVTWIFNQAQAPGVPIEPSAASGASGASGGVLSVIGVPQSGPGAEWNAVIAFASEIGLAVALAWAAAFTVELADQGPRATAARVRLARLAYLSTWAFAGVLLSVLAFLWLRVVATAFVAAVTGLAAWYLAARLDPSATVSRLRPAVAMQGAAWLLRLRADRDAAAASLAVFLGSVAALVWLAIFPGTFGPSFR